jgi:hypothetical protein
MSTLGEDLRAARERLKLARQNAATAVAESGDVAERVVVEIAANSILDRGWGKPAQPIENGDDGAFELIHRIERVIVDLQIETAKVFEPLLQPARYKGAWGGRGSGKSHFFGEMLVEECQAPAPGGLHP